MDKLTKKYVVLLCAAFICLFLGFFICTISPKSIFVGIPVTGIGMVFALFGLFPAAKVFKRQIKEKENRMKSLEKRVKSLEEEVELLKKKNRD